MNYAKLVPAHRIAIPLPTVVVNNPIDAVNDPSVTVASNNTVVTALNALTNDTLSNIAATTTNTNVTPLTTGPLSIDANGIVTVAANTQVVRTASSTNYEANPSTGLNVSPANCDTATASCSKQSNRCSERSIGNCCIKQYGSNGIERIDK
jgi:hypothetical protein